MGPAQQFRPAERSAVAMQRTLLTKELLERLPKTPAAMDTWSSDMTLQRARRIGASTNMMLAEAHVHLLVNTIDAQVVIFQDRSSERLEVIEVCIAFVHECMWSFYYFSMLSPMCLLALLVL